VKIFCHFYFAINFIEKEKKSNTMTLFLIKMDHISNGCGVEPIFVQPARNKLTFINSIFFLLLLLLLAILNDYFLKNVACTLRWSLNFFSRHFFNVSGYYFGEIQPRKTNHKLRLHSNVHTQPFYFQCTYFHKAHSFYCYYIFDIDVCCTFSLCIYIAR
jgi:hypothetical protein